MSKKHTKLSKTEALSKLASLKCIYDTIGEVKERRRVEGGDIKPLLETMSKLTSEMKPLVKILKGATSGKKCRHTCEEHG